MNALARWQNAMHDWLLHRHAGVAARVEGADANARLRIYADAYHLRLLDVLGNDFPTTKAALGETAFASLAEAYLREHPSRQPSVRHFGHAFAVWLSLRDDIPPFLPQLARFEWTQGECFDAQDAPLMGVDAVAGLPADAWPTLRLHLHPATRLLRLACNAPALVTALAAGTTLPELRSEPDAIWLLWRCEGDVHWRRLEPDEAIALSAAAAGEPFAAICERMTAIHEHDGSLRAASLLKRWLADGLLTSQARPTSDQGDHHAPLCHFSSRP